MSHPASFEQRVRDLTIARCEAELRKAMADAETAEVVLAHTRLTVGLKPPRGELVVLRPEGFK